VVRGRGLLGRGRGGHGEMVQGGGPTRTGLLEGVSRFYSGASRHWRLRLR
jgi:hypothetical protein